MPTSTGHTKAICASQVIGADVYSQAGEKVGKLQDIVLDKTTSRIMLAVARVGGVVTTSESYHPLPWSALDYNEDKRGYVVPYTRDQLASGPSYGELSEVTKGDGVAARDAAFIHYKAERDQ